MQLSQSLRVRSYPYIALLAFSGSRTRLITAAEGLFNTTELLLLLQQAQDSQSASLIAEQIERTEQVLRPHCPMTSVRQSQVFWAQAQWLSNLLDAVIIHVKTKDELNPTMALFALTILA